MILTRRMLSRSRCFKNTLAYACGECIGSGQKMSEIEPIDLCAVEFDHIVQVRAHSLRSHTIIHYGVSAFATQASVARCLPLVT